MKRLFLSLAGVLLLAACTAGTPTITPGSVPTDAGEAAVDALCEGTAGTSLADLATQLDSVDASADTSALQGTLALVGGQIGTLNVTGDAATARDAAVSAVERLTTSLSDPNALPQAAADAAAALRNLESSLCM